MNFSRGVRWIGLVLLAMAMLLIGAWCLIAVWYHCNSGGLMYAVLTGATAVFILATVAGLATRRRWLVFGVYSAAVGLFLAWWATISPMSDRDWAPDVARSVTATIDGDRLVVSNVRNFTWRTETDFDPGWEQRTYIVSHVT